MLFDLFSGFDDHNQVAFSFSFGVWGVVFVSLSYLFVFFWASWVLFYSVIFFFVKVVDGLVSRSVAFLFGGSLGFFGSLFLVLIFSNLFGLVPYVFSVTSHLAVNLSLSFPVWFGVVLMSMAYDLGGFLSHLQPLGSPAFLNPFLCVIEAISLIVRPITLSVRLTANLSTGHILMALLGVGFGAGGFVVALLVVFVGMFYFIFEMGVCGVQSYIFTLLPVLYSDEHPA